jgi:hypothetical protein
MAANFPTSLPSFTNPSGADNLSSPAHATQHSNENDEIVALGTKIGTGASTPTSGKVLQGNGTGTSVWGDPNSIYVARQDNTTNNTAVVRTIQVGWGFILGNGLANIYETITFATAFTEPPVVVLNYCGYKADSDPATLDELAGLEGSTYAQAQKITTTGFWANMTSAGTFSATIRYGYSWIAIGTV